MTDRETAQLGPSGDGSVMIDIGGDRGALVIMTPADMLGVEIDITPKDPDEPMGWSHEHAPDDHSHDARVHDDHVHEGDHAHGDHAQGDHGHSHVHVDADGRRTRREHVAVRERRSPGGIRHAAIFPSLREGEYTLFDQQGNPAHTVTIVGGQVAELDWQ